MRCLTNKQNVLLNIGIGFILAGIAFLLYLNNLLPDKYFYEYINLFLGIITIIIFLRTKNKSMLFATVFFFSNALTIGLGNLLNTSSFIPRMVIIIGVLLLTAYISHRKSVILTLGSLLTFWGIFIFIKEPMGIYGYYFSLGALMLFTVLAFILIWIMERQNWPILPIGIFSILGIYFVADALSIPAKNMILQIACMVLIIVGVIFVIKSLFNNHLGE